MTSNAANPASGASVRDPAILVYARQIIMAPDEWTPHYTRAELLPMAKAYVLLVACEEAEGAV